MFLIYRLYMHKLTLYYQNLENDEIHIDHEDL